VVRVGEQGEPQASLFIELPQLGGQIGADPDSRRLQLLELLQGVPDALSLDCSAGGPGLGIEIQEQFGSSEIG
jgi:hypothetical protein